MTILTHFHRWNIPRKALNVRLDGTHGPCIASVAKRTSIPWSSTLCSGHYTDSGMKKVQVQSPPHNVVSTYIVPQLTSFCPETIFKPRAMDTYDAEDVFELLNYRGKKLMFYDVEIWNQRALEVRNLRLSLRRGLRRFWSWLRGLGWLKVASRNLRSFTGRGSETQPHKEIWGHLLATSRTWRRRKGLCLTKVRAWFLQVKFRGTCIATCVFG